MNIYLKIIIKSFALYKLKYITYKRNSLTAPNEMVSTIIQFNSIQFFIINVPSQQQTPITETAQCVYNIT
jgi:hypothetical protein